MKKYLFVTAAVAAALISGCGAKEEPAGLTQAISESSVSADTAAESFAKTSTEASMQETSEASQTAADPQTADSGLGATALQGTSGDISADAERYYRVKAEKDAVEIDIENLEASYRVGELDRAGFEAQRMELKAEEDSLDMEEDMLEAAMDLYYYQSGEALPEGDPQTLMDESMELKMSESELEIEDHRLEADYRSGAISREDFIEKKTEIVRSEEELDRREDLLERTLERMGYDD